MKLLLVFAPPSAHSLNAHLKDQAIQRLDAAGHEIRVSDLYARKWKAVAGEEDFPQRDISEPFSYEMASGEAYRESRFDTPD